jgi:hypothetical protein
MKIQILDEAQLDLAYGFQFYEMQSDGLGDYFLNSLFQTSIPCRSMQVFMLDTLAIIAYLPRDFPSPFIIELRIKLFEYMLCWIAGGIRHGFKTD